MSLHEIHFIETKNGSKVAAWMHKSTKAEWMKLLSKQLSLMLFRFRCWWRLVFGEAGACKL